MEGLLWETAEEMNLDLARRVRNIRKRRKISQERLSKISGVSYGSVKRFESTGNISLLSLTKIAMALGLAEEIRQILTTEYDENLDQLYQLGGTSGSTRPKISTKVEDEEWMIKFPDHVDGMNAGLMEYEYSLCAKQCGIHMSETRLFPSQICKGYFGTKRFDRGKDRIHMCTAAALLELDYHQPSLDYHSLMKLTKIITGDDPEDMENMYRRMCFNVFAHNRDDHSKNFTFLYDEKENRWKLSPAYDLTYSSTYYGEHTTSVDGNGQNPGIRELVNVGAAAGISRKKCRELAEFVRECVEQCLGSYFHTVR